MATEIVSSSVIEEVDEGRLESIRGIFQTTDFSKVDETAFLKEMFETLTIAESTLIGVGIFAGETEATPDEQLGFLDRVDALLMVCKIIGIPVHLPINQMNDAQKAAIEAGKEDLRVVSRLIKLWQKAGELA